LHNAAFAALALDYVYVPLPVAPAAVATAVRGLAALGLWGANVTVPHKRAVVPYLDELDDDARLAGAVNTIVIREGRLQGHNTDIDGFGRAVLEAAPATPRGRPAALQDQLASENAAPAALAGQPVLLLGAGGVARAAAVWLARAGADLTVVNRTPAAAAEVVAVARAAAPGVTARSLPLAALTAAHAAAAAVLVNATSLGMQGAGKVPAVVVDNVREDHVVCDVVYGRRPTPLIVQARKRGARAVDGLSILVWQAAAAFELWTGVVAPVDVMRSAVTR
jgi:shikimate dehydrogenase